jgi:hypothetical protein
VHIMRAIFNQEATAKDFVKSLAAKAVPPLRLVAGVATLGLMLKGNFAAAGASGAVALGLGKAQDHVHSKGWDEIPIFDPQFKRDVEGVVTQVALGAIGTAAVAIGGAGIASGTAEGVGYGFMLVLAGGYALKEVGVGVVDTIRSKVKKVPNADM